VAGYLIGGIALIGAFVVIEQRQPAPMLPLSIFRVPTMTASLLASLFQGLASFAVLFLVIMYLQGPRGLSPIHASLLLVPGYVLGSVAGPYAGRLADRRGPVLPAAAGLAIQVAPAARHSRTSQSPPVAGCDRGDARKPLGVPANKHRGPFGIILREELRELLIDAWCMVAPKKTAAGYLDSQGIGRD
jgi:hypothetical protein